MDIKGTSPCTACWSTAAARHRGGVLLLLPARPRPTAPTWRMASRRGRHGDRGARRRAARRAGQGRRSTPIAGVDAGQGRRDRRAGRVPGRAVATRSPTCWSSCGTSSSSEDATLVEVNPLVKTGDGSIVALDGKVTLDENADFRHPDHAALEDKAAADPLEAQGQGEAPQLRQARRRGRHHRQRRRPGHVDPRRRRLRRREARRRQAGQLPRHRRRRLAPR